MRTRDDEAELARAFESDLEEYPDERGEILTEAAGAWRRAGNHDRAIELLTEAVSLGGQDGGVARVELADLLFELGRDDEARAQLDALRKNRPNSAMPFHLAAELMEERGAYKEALTWFNFAVARLGSQELEAAHNRMSYAGCVVAGRRGVRRELGLPPDQLDEVSDAQEHDPFVSDELAHDLAASTRAAFQVLFWPRAEALKAHERWPELVQHTDVDGATRERELANRELVGIGGGHVVMVPLTVAGLAEFASRTGTDPADKATRHAYMMEVVAEGGAISWPPQRNAPCWCGSGAKYKKCCGHAD